MQVVTPSASSAGAAVSPEALAGIRDSLESIRGYVAKQFAGSAAQGRVDQFNQTLNTLLMSLDHLHEEAGRMENYRYEGHNVTPVDQAAQQRMSDLEAEIARLRSEVAGG